MLCQMLNHLIVSNMKSEVHLIVSNMESEIGTSDCQQHGVRNQNIYSAATWSQNLEQLIVSNMDSETGTSDCQLHGV